MAKLRVSVIPRSSRSCLAHKDGVLTAHLHAPPADGRANVELITLLSKSLGISRADFSLVRGAKSRHKEVEVLGIDAAALQTLLASRLLSK